MFTLIYLLSTAFFLIVGLVIGEFMANQIWALKAKSGFWMRHNGRVYEVKDITDSIIIEGEDD